MPFAPALTCPGCMKILGFCVFGIRQSGFREKNRGRSWYPRLVKSMGPRAIATPPCLRYRPRMRTSMGGMAERSQRAEDANATAWPVNAIAHIFRQEQNRRS